MAVPGEVVVVLVVAVVEVLVDFVGGRGGAFPGDLGGQRGRGGRGFWREKWVGGLQGPRSVDSVTQAYPCSQERFIVARLPVLQISLNLYIKLCISLAMAGRDFTELVCSKRRGV